MKQTIEDASKEYGKKIILGSQGFEEVDFKRGAEWQKEQLQPLADSHAELLRLVILSEKYFKNLNDAREFVIALNLAIEKAQQLTNK